MGIMGIMEHGKIAKIATLTGINYKTFWRYCRRPPKRFPFGLAQRLERVLGVDKLVWLQGDPVLIQKALEKVNP